MLTVDSLLAGRLDVFADAFRHLFLPSIALAAAGIGQVMRITRSSMIEGEIAILSKFPALLESLNGWLPSVICSELLRLLH